MSKIFVLIAAALGSLLLSPAAGFAQGTDAGDLDWAESQWTFDMNDKLLEQLIPYEFRSELAQEEAFYVANIFARCAVKLNEDRARALLDKSMGKGVYLDEEQAYYDRLKNCAIKRKLVDREFMRGSLAAHVLLRNEDMADVQSAMTKEELVDFLKSVEVTDQKFVRSLTSTQVGYQCRAAMVPSAAYAILEHEPGSKKEAAAIERLEAKTPFCDVLFKEESPSNWFARAFVARGLYHWNQYRQTHPIEG